MVAALKELMKDEIDAERADATNVAVETVSIEHIKNIMSEFKCTAEQAMNALKIDPSKRGFYASMLQNEKK